MSRKTVKGHHCFVTTGKVVEIDRPGHVVWLGEFNGPFVNLEGGESFLNGTAWRCPGMQEVVDGKTVDGRGYCIVSDKDNNMAFLRWEATPSSVPGELKGRSWWVGESTGKFKDLKGENTWEMAFQVPPNPARNEDGVIGFSNFEGWYELPDTE